MVSKHLYFGEHPLTVKVSGMLSFTIFSNNFCELYTRMRANTNIFRKGNKMLVSDFETK